MSTPYRQTTVSPAKSKGEIEELFARYRVTDFTFGQRQADGGVLELAIQFRFRDLPVRLQFTAEGLLQTMLKQEPWTPRRTMSKDAYTEKLRDQANRAVWRHVAHWLKVTFEQVEFGILGFEQAFLFGFVDRSGRTLGEVLVPQLQEINAGVKSLPEVTP